MLRPTGRWLVVAAVGAAGAAGFAAVQQPERPLANARPVSAPAPATTSVEPAYLPAGATLATDGRGYPRFPDVRENQYVLAGAANADTIPPEGVTEANALRVHPDNRLVVTFVPGLTRLPESVVDPVFYDVRPVTVAGLPGLLSSPKDGFGTIRVDWIDGEGYHVVLCERLDHVEGVAGLDADEVLRVASSLYG